MSKIEWGRVVSRIVLWLLIGAAVGGSIGYFMATFSPGIYYSWFDREYVDRVGPLFLGVTLGLWQGAIVGAIVGLLVSVLPWFRGIANARTSVVCDFDSSTGLLRMRARTTTPVLVLGVWAPYEAEAVALFDRPFVVNDEGCELAVQAWSKFDGTAQQTPKSGRLGVYAVGPQTST